MTHWCPATGSDPSAPDAWRTGSALAALSHDLRTPLNAMLGFSQLLADCLIPAEDLSAVVTDILTSGEELLMQVIDVLNLACLEEMSPPFALAGVDIREIVLSALGRITPVLMKRQQGMDYIHADNLPPVPADAGWLGMALDRLLMEVAQSA